jgi:hypothetical protein
MLQMPLADYNGPKTEVLQRELPNETVHRIAKKPAPGDLVVPAALRAGQY